VGKAGLVCPFVGVFSLPSPLKPAGALFVSDGLSFPVLSQKRLVAGAERRSIAGEPSAAADFSRARVGAVIA